MHGRKIAFLCSILQLDICFSTLVANVTFCVYSLAMFNIFYNTDAVTTDAVTIGIFCLNAILETIAAGIMFAKHRQQNDRSRLFIAFFFLMSALGSFGEIAIALLAPNYSDGFLLMDSTIILCGFAIFFLLLLYPIEMLRPNWLDWRRTLTILSPWLLLAALLVVLHYFTIRPLHSIDDIFLYINEPDVILRVILTFIFLPYGIWLLCLPYNWENSSAPLPWLRLVIAIIFCMTITYFASRGLRFFWAHIAHEVFYILLTCIILYMELAIRLRVPDNKISSDYTPPTIPLTFAKKEEICDTSSPDIVVIRLRQALDDAKIWKNPDLTQEEVLQLIGTNRTYLLRTIKQIGYNNYSDMLNRYRVEYIRTQLQSNPSQNLQNIFYEAGYRSRTSAWRNFTAITGCSPADFCQKKIDNTDSAT